MFKKFKQVSAAARLQEEKLYEQVAQELESGERRDGLWVKALANAQGVEEKAQGLYIRYRVQSIKDEHELDEYELTGGLAKVFNEAIERARLLEAARDPSHLKSEALDRQEDRSKEAEKPDFAPMPKSKELFRQEDRLTAAEKSDISTRIEIEHIIKGARWADLKSRRPDAIESEEQGSLLRKFIKEYERVHFPLHKAAWGSDYSLAETLLLFGFDASLENTDGRTVRDMAVGDKDIIELLESPWR